MTAGKQLDYLEWLFGQHPNDKSATKDVGLAKSEQAAFEAWLSEARPPGDCTDVHEQWLRSEARAEFLDAAVGADPYADVKAAFADGELQINMALWNEPDQWEDYRGACSFVHAPRSYRRKPKSAAQPTARTPAEEACYQEHKQRAESQA